ncbi:MAG: hypothetical protein QOH48_21 [Actinomycetota bacterium]|jgi:anti-sigma-K factor RskA|nr:hypothetical protein [Actinomycetota bacterium]
MELSHEAVKDLIAPYILGAVSPDEERSIRAHVMSCEECMQEAESFSAVTTALPLAADPVPLPSGFVERVVTQVHDSRPLSGVDKSRARSPWYRRWSGFQVVATSGLLIVALILGAFLMNERRSLDQRQKALAALLQHENDAMELHGVSGAVAKVIPTSSGSIFVASGLNEAPDRHTYQLWLIKNGTPISAGTFDIKGGVAVLESTRALTGVDQAAVTIEPSGGSAQPTSTPIITSG